MESDLKSLVEDLEDNLDDLTDAIDPLVNTPLRDSASKLPIVDKAKLHVLHVYALESLLFSYLRLNGIKAKDHPIMRELARVKQYMAKIKNAEDNAAWSGGAGLHLDKEAAGRFIKHALAANERMDRIAKENEAKEKEAKEKEAKEKEAKEKEAKQKGKGSALVQEE